MTHEEGGFVDFFNDVWLKIMAEQEGVMVALLSAIAFGILVSLKLTYEERSQQRQQHQPTASEETTTNQPGVEVDGDGEESKNSVTLMTTQLRPMTRGWTSLTISAIALREHPLQPTIKRCLMDCR